MNQSTNKKLQCKEYSDQNIHHSPEADSKTEMVPRLGEGKNQIDKVKVITKAGLFDILAVADAVVVPNIHTTASLEALIAGQPIVYISTARIYDKGFSWTRYGGCLIVNTLQDIPLLFGKLLYDNNFREKLIAEGRKLLQKYYSAEGRESIHRICELLT